MEHTMPKIGSELPQDLLPVSQARGRVARSTWRKIKGTSARRDPHSNNNTQQNGYRHMVGPSSPEPRIPAACATRYRTAR